MNKESQPLNRKKDEIIEYLKMCYLIGPNEITQLSNHTLKNFSKQIATKIEELGHNHMLSLSPEDAFSYLQNGLTFVYSDPKKEEVLGFIKTYQWKCEHVTKVLEIGSLFVDPMIQNHRIGQLLVEQMAHYAEQFLPHLPIVSVVDSDNIASLKLYRRLYPQWHEEYPNDPNLFYINSINIFEGWGKHSSIFIYPNTYEQKSN